MLFVAYAGAQIQKRFQLHQPFSKGTIAQTVRHSALLIQIYDKIIGLVCPQFVGKTGSFNYLQN